MRRRRVELADRVAALEVRGSGRRCRTRGSAASPSSVRSPSGRRGRPPALRLHVGEHRLEIAAALRVRLALQRSSTFRQVLLGSIFMGPPDQAMLRRLEPLTEAAARLLSGAEAHRQREAAHVGRVHAHRARLVDLVVRDPPQHLLERDARLEPRERGAEAEVRAAPEREVRAGVAVDVEDGPGSGTPARRGWPSRSAAAPSGRASWRGPGSRSPRSRCAPSSWVELSKRSVSSTHCGTSAGLSLTSLRTAGCFESQ